MKIYTVKDGDSVQSIAATCGIAPTRLAEDNGIGVRERLFAGEELVISEATRRAYARRGDDVECLARRYGARREDVIAYNPELGFGEGLYEGQSLTLKVDSARYGMGIGNGYYYYGCPRERLISLLPYASYITVSAAIYENGRISMTFSDEEVVDIAKRRGKLPLLRIYEKDAPRGGYSEFSKSAAMLTKGHGYIGATLAGWKGESKEEKRHRIAEMRRAFIECGLKLFVEDELENPSGISDLADGVILFYDKLNKDKILAFNEEEGLLMKKYADNEDSIRSFIGISPYAYSDGKYISKDEVIKKIRRATPQIARIADGEVIIATVGGGRREKAYFYESLEGLRKRLVSVSENGYYGVSFDIGRCSINELLMFRLMFTTPITI